MWRDVSMAMAGAGQSQPQGGAAAGMTAMLPILLMVVIFYFLLIRPQVKEKRRHQDMLTNLKRGDLVVTTGGILGKIINITDETISIEVGNKVRLEVLRSAVSRLQTENIGNKVET